MEVWGTDDTCNDYVVWIYYLKHDWEGCNVLTDWRMYLIYGRNAVLSISDKIYALAVDKCHWGFIRVLCGTPFGSPVISAC